MMFLAVYIIRLRLSLLVWSSALAAKITNFLQHFTFIHLDILKFWQNFLHMSHRLMFKDKPLLNVMQYQYAYWIEPFFRK